jgi:hypothetical protein
MMLEQSSSAVLDEQVHLFPPRSATEYYQMRSLPSPGAGKFSGANPAFGALITYYLKDDPPSHESRVKIQVVDKDGAVIRELDGPDQRGYNRIAWDLRYALTFKPGPQDEGWFGPPKGTLALPGEYQIKLLARGRELTQPLQVRVDPRSRTTPENLRARFDASQKVAELARTFGSAVEAVDSLGHEMEAIKSGVQHRKDVPSSVTAHIDTVSKQLETMRSTFRAGFGGPKFQYLDLAGQLQASTSAPTEAQLIAIDNLTNQLSESIAKLNELITREVPQLESELKSSNINPYNVQPVAPPKIR